MRSPDIHRMARATFEKYQVYVQKSSDMLESAHCDPTRVENMLLVCQVPGSATAMYMALTRVQLKCRRIG
jgi:hypothetical protein